MDSLLNQVTNGDCIEIIKNIPTSSIHLIASDIPYGIGMDDWDVLHDNTNNAYMGTSPAQLKAGAIFKKRGKPINGWSEADRAIPRQYYEWCLTWAPEWYRTVKPGGSVFIFAGRRYSHRCITAMEDSGFTFKDMFSWMRDKAPHRAQRVSSVYARRNDVENAEKWEGWRLGNLRPTFEPVLWFQKPYRIGGTIADNLLEHGVGAYNQEAFVKYAGTPDNVISASFRKRESGLHPTQKPIDLMKCLIELTTQPDQIVLDPFCGSGTTLVAAKELNRRYIGIEQSAEYFAISKDRLEYKLL
jgi:site-specific DNA-methyltransferase (adenine-specific)